MARANRNFPKLLPTTVVGELDFEVGFPLDHVKNLTIGSDLLCGICRGVPRHPLELKCGHFFCRTCINQLMAVTNRAKRRKLLTFHEKADCPLCRKQFTAFDITDDRNFQSTLTRLFLSIRVLCPFDCGFESEPRRMDEHQVKQCPNRPIRCPNYLCPVMGTAKEVETEHFQTCQYYRLFCPRCQLAVRQDELETHDCLKRQQQALYKFHQHFLSHGGKINPLCVQGPAGKALLYIPWGERDEYEEKAKDEYLEIDMSDSDVSNLEDMLPLPIPEPSYLDTSPIPVVTELHS